MDEPSPTQTEFNSNIATLIRIDNLLRRCAEASYNDDISAYFRDLRNLRKEARVKMKHKQLAKKCTTDCPRCLSDAQFDEIDRMYQLYSGYKKDKNFCLVLLKKLDRYENDLRDFMNLKGMLLSENVDQGL